MKYVCKIYLKNRLLISGGVGLLASALLFVCYIISALFKYKNHITAFDPINTILSFATFIAFSAMLLVSFEFFRLNKLNNIKETISAIRGGDEKFFLCQLFVLTILNLFLSLIFLCLMLFIFSFCGSLCAQTIYYSFAFVFFNFFLIMFLAQLLGKLLSSVKGRAKAYTGLSVTLIIVFGGAALCFGILNKYGMNLSSFPYFLNIFSPELRVSTNEFFCYSVLPHRFFILFFWIFLTAFIIVAKKKKQFRVKIAAVLFVLMLANFCFGMLQQSKVVFDFCYNSDEYIDEASYYYAPIDENNEFVVEQKNEPAEFEVTQYDLDLSIYLNFKAKACLTVDKADLTEYKFTLYHTYKLSKVTDQDGNRLDFEQNGDYITVKNNGFDIRQIVMYYKGNSPTYFANVQAVELYGGFAYYPVAGFHKVYNVDFGYYDLSSEKTMQFNVSVRSPLKIYSNLDEVSNGRFSSKSNALTLVGGFVDSKTVDGVEYIYPYICNDDADFKQWSNAMLSGIIPKREKILLVPNKRRMNVYDDYILAECTVCDIEENAEFSFMDIDKYVLWYYSSVDKHNFDDIGNFSANFDSPTQSYDHRLYKKCIEKYGIGELYEYIENYIYDDADKRTPDEFLADLYKG